MDVSKNNPDKSSTTKVNEGIPSGFSMSTTSLFKDMGNKYDVYRDKDCMKKFCEYLRKNVMNIVISKRKE